MEEQRNLTPEERANRRIKIINGLADNSLDPGKVYTSLLAAITNEEGFGYDRAAVFTIDEKLKRIKGEYAAGLEVSELENILSGEKSISLTEDNILTRAFKDQKPYLRQNGTNLEKGDNICINSCDMPLLGSEEYAIVPMKRNGIVNGLIYFDNVKDNGDLRSIRKIDVMQVREIAEYAALEIIKCHNHQKLRSYSKMLKEEAYTDTVTRVRTLKYVWHEWDKWRESKHKNIFVFLYDIDGFKILNNLYGHLGCNEVMQKVAGKVNTILQKENGLFGRLGGDEFLGVLHDVSEDYAHFVFQSCIDSINKAPIIARTSDRKKMKANVTISGGFTRYTHGHKRSAMKKADKALYYSKDHGRNMLSFYGPGGEIKGFKN